MKYLLVVFVLLSTQSKAQRVALLHLGFREPITYTDKVSLEIITKGVFPLYLKDAKAVVKAVEALEKKMYQKAYDRAATDSVVVGNSVLRLHTDKQGFKRKYNLNLCTEAEGFKACLDLVNETYDKTAQKRILAFLDYLRNNISIVDGAVSVHK